MLENGADPNIPCLQKAVRYPLLNAISTGKIEIANLILDSIKKKN